jgi:hypothetical protein
MSKINSLDSKKGSELLQDTDLKNNDRKSRREKKHFSFKDLFKKKE